MDRAESRDLGAGQKRPIRVARAMLALLGAMIGLQGCAPRLTRLHAPRDAEPWDARLGAVFDDGLTVTPVTLVGRAPHDVLDQKRFGQRIGHSDVIARVEVERVWSKERHGAAQERFLDVEIVELMMGVLPKSVKPDQTIALQRTGDVPTRLEGQQLLLFLRWSPEDEPQYHHHMMAAGPDETALIRVLVADAELRREIPAQDARRRRRGVGR